jgi:hypothetical protein
MAAGHRIEHPLWNLQEPSSWLLIDGALEHSSPIPGESFVDRHCASVPRMPRIKDFSRFDIMGVALSTCTMRTGRISGSRRTRQQVGLQQFALRLKPRFIPFRESAGCTIVMRWQRRLKSHFSEDQTRFLETLPRNRSCFLRASFAGRRISLPSTTEELTASGKKSV